jgi:flagellar hook-length control protein FliK
MAAMPATGLGSSVAPLAAEQGSATSVAATSTTAASSAAAGDAAAQQIIRGMRLQWSGSVGEAQLRLQPENLGQVYVSVRVDQGTVSATLRADSAAAQQWIQTHQQDLKQALQDQGLQVSEIIVTNEPDQRQQRGNQQERENASRGRQARRQDSTADQPRFEIRV